MLLCLPAIAYAAPEVDVTQSLHFGNFIPQNNDGLYQITVASDGGVTADPHMIQTGGVTPRNGTFQLSGFADEDAVTITFDPDPVLLNCGCGGPGFTVGTFVIDPDPVDIDEFGEATVNFGATLTTDGSTVRYSGATYTGDITVEVTIDEI